MGGLFQDVILPSEDELHKLQGLGINIKQYVADNIYTKFRH